MTSEPTERRVGWLPGVAVLEGVAIVGLGAWLLMGGSGAAPSEAASRDTTARARETGAVEAKPEGNASPAAEPTGGAPAAATEKPETAPPPSATLDAGVVLHGALRDPTGQLVDGARVWARPADGGDAAGNASSEAGRYAIAGLTPGPIVLTASSERHHEKVERVEIPGGVLVLEHDVVLEPAVILPVRVTTPDGKSLHQAMVDAKLWVEVNAAATAAAPGATLSFTPHRGDGHGAAEWRPNDMEETRRRLPREVLGELKLLAPLPLHVSLVLGPVVIDTQRVEPGAGEVAFTLPLDRLRAQLGKVSLRVVDGATGLPLPSATVGVGRAGVFGGGRAVGSDGRLALTDVMPGRMYLTGFAKDYAQLRSPIDVPAGGSLDLGDVAMHRPVAIRGRIVDEHGKPLQCNISYLWADVTSDERMSMSAQVDAEGRFEIKHMAPGRYVLLAFAGDRRAHAAVSTLDGPAECTLRFQPSFRVRITVDKAAATSEPRTLIVRDERGAPLLVTTLRPAYPLPVNLATGSYTIEVRDGDGRHVLSTQPLRVQGQDVTVTVR